jgi:hypothetical protein
VLLTRVFFTRTERDLILGFIEEPLSVRESADEAQIPCGSKNAFGESNSGETDFSARLIKFVIYCVG